ncbi:hypothetical protein GE061_004929 [Apolygus lucorum]|uniref:Uncharacterized protein n=1 Tax=Apolygus lucorum TaxID=248454 RepID=A0A8S9WXF6_APOLU|nr:hypothetical protein GE061_004929 [Apolygus lucorum]
MSMMNHRENRSEREYKLIVIWKLLDDHISVREHKIVVKNMLKPQMRDLMAAIKEVYPYLEREQYSVYCRYGGSELFPIFDHMTMVTAFALMEAHESPLLYLIRKDIGEWINKHPQLMKNPEDIKLLFEAKHPERWTTEYGRGRAEHMPDEGLEGARVASAKKKSRVSPQGGGRKSNAAKAAWEKDVDPIPVQDGTYEAFGQRLTANILWLLPKGVAKFPEPLKIRKVRYTTQDTHGTQLNPIGGAIVRLKAAMSKPKVFLQPQPENKLMVSCRFDLSNVRIAYRFRVKILGKNQTRVYKWQFGQRSHFTLDALLDFDQPCLMHMRQGSSFDLELVEGNGGDLREFLQKYMMPILEMRLKQIVGPVKSVIDLPQNFPRVYRERNISLTASSVRIRVVSVVRTLSDSKSNEANRKAEGAFRFWGRNAFGLVESEDDASLTFIGLPSERPWATTGTRRRSPDHRPTASPPQPVQEREDSLLGRSFVCSPGRNCRRAK